MLNSICKRVNKKLTNRNNIKELTFAVGYDILKLTRRNNIKL
ncbi:MAG: hypothetical protein RR847_04885 [Bacilli bacterium]